MPSLSGCGDVAAVGAHAVAEHFGVDVGAAGLGVLQFLEHEHAGPFAQDEAVAVAVEGAAGARRVVVALREGPHGGKAARPMRVTAASLPPVIITSASSYWMARKASPMALAALAQAVTMHCVGPAQPPLDRDLAAGRVGDQLGNGEGRDLVRTLVQQPLVLGLDFPQAADARTDHHAAAERVFAWRSRCPSPCTASMRGDHGELREAIEPLLVAGVDVARGATNRTDLAAEADAVGRGVETAKRMRPRSRRCRRESRLPRPGSPSEVTAPKPVTTTRRFMDQSA